MDFNFSEEQQLLADTVQRFVRDTYSFEARREILKSKAGWSRETWQALSGLGLTALNVPEEHGGLGSGPVETMLVMNALGEGLLLEPFMPAAVITPVLLTRLGDTT
ncbi:MAG: acyl-CoA dehydrogenase family protein, partial [Steroidobacter sp.]